MHDVLIIGAGIAGALVADRLSQAGRRVLIVEAGEEAGFDPGLYHAYVDRFYRSAVKVPNAPYPNTAAAPAPSVLDIQQIEPGRPDTTGYFVQRGPLPFGSNYTRQPGGTALHWLGECIRMLPPDFELRSRYGQGVDWPIGYDDLRPFYEQAERAIGVSGDVEDQIYPGVDRARFFGRYEYPMRRIPMSYVDQFLDRGLRGMEYELDGERYPIRVVSTPVGRNSVPRPGYEPVGAVGHDFKGLRCEGNASCVPICPVQAKYNPLKTLRPLVREGKVSHLAQHVASRLEIDPDTGRITGVVCKRYDGIPAGDGPIPYEEVRLTAQTYVVAANAIETAKLMLASGAARHSTGLGENLMDHFYMLTWGVAPRPVGAYRGPSNTSGIPSLRDGAFRNRSAAFRMTIGNWGWNFPTGAPWSDVDELVDRGNLFGPKLRAAVYDRVQRQMSLGFLVEQTPSARNRVTIDPAWTDRLGNHRPVIDYHVSDYDRAGMAVARAFSDALFRRLGVEDRTAYQPTDPGYVEYEGHGYTYHGAGHVVGTHRMGTCKGDSVVDDLQRTWEHDNLYLVGAGSMPTIGTSNPTLTLAALALRTADHLARA